MNKHRMSPQRKPLRLRPQETSDLLAEPSKRMNRHGSHFILPFSRQGVNWPAPHEHLRYLQLSVTGPSSARLAARGYRSIHTRYSLDPLRAPKLFTKLSTGFSTEPEMVVPSSYLTRTRGRGEGAWPQCARLARPDHCEALSERISHRIPQYRLLRPVFNRTFVASTDTVLGR